MKPIVKAVSARQTSLKFHHPPPSSTPTMSRLEGSAGAFSRTTGTTTSIILSNAIISTQAPQPPPPLAIPLPTTPTPSRGMEPPTFRWHCRTTGTRSSHRRAATAPWDARDQYAIIRSSSNSSHLTGWATSTSGGVCRTPRDWTLWSPCDSGRKRRRSRRWGCIDLSFSDIHITPDSLAFTFGLHDISGSTVPQEQVHRKSTSSLYPNNEG